MKITATVNTITIKGAIYRYFIRNGFYWGFEAGEAVRTNAKTLTGFKRIWCK